MPIHRGDAHILIMKKRIKKYQLIIGSFVSDKLYSFQTSISTAPISRVLSSLVRDACAFDGIWDARHTARWLPMLSITNCFSSFTTDASAVDVSIRSIGDDLYNIFSDILLSVEVFAVRVLAVVYLVNETPSVSFAVVSSSPQWPISPRIFGF